VAIKGILKMAGLPQNNNKTEFVAQFSHILLGGHNGIRTRGVEAFFGSPTCGKIDVIIRKDTRKTPDNTCGL
jgi:hypothetical protein